MIEQYYSIAVRKRNDSKDRFFNHEDFCFMEIKIPLENHYWYADPFLFEYNGVCYLFFEAYDLIEQKGKIAYSILRDDYTATKPKIIIERDYHFSFPDEWKEEKALLRGVLISDLQMTASLESRYLCQQ